MIVIDSKTPIEMIDFDVICYCPVANNAFEHGITICRIKEFEFLIGILNFNPRGVIDSSTIPFSKKTPGFVWKCPDTLQDRLLNNSLLIKDILQYWLQLDESIGMINTCFQLASLDLLYEYFPMQDLIIKELHSEFLSETELLKNIPLRQSTFFKDQYEGQWIISRSNISRLCIVQVMYDPKRKELKFSSEAYLMNELVMVVLQDYIDNKEWEYVTLGELLKIKNLMLRRTTYDSIPRPFEDCFQLYPVAEIEKWMTSFKLKRNDVLWKNDSETISQ